MIYLYIATASILVSALLNVLGFFVKRPVVTTFSTFLALVGQGSLLYFVMLFFDDFITLANIVMRHLSI